MLVTKLEMLKPVEEGGKACYGTSKSSTLWPILANEPAKAAKGSSSQQPKGGEGEWQGEGAARRWPAS